MLAVLMIASTASAGWVTLRNDSPRSLVVQEVIKSPDGTTKRSRPTRLLPGETLREFRAGPMSKWIEVYDMQAPDKPIFNGRIAWKDGNAIFSISSNGKSAAVKPVPGINSSIVTKQK